MDFMIRTKTGQYYRVPEDMFPFAARNMVAQGTADIVEPPASTLVDKIKTVVSDVKQVVHQKVETAAIKRDMRTAARPAAPSRVLLDTDQGEII